MFQKVIIQNKIRQLFLTTYNRATVAYDFLHNPSVNPVEF